MPKTVMAVRADAVPLISTRSPVGLADDPALFTTKSKVFTPGWNPEAMVNAVKAFNVVPDGPTGAPFSNIVAELSDAICPVSTTEDGFKLVKSKVVR